MSDEQFKTLIWVLICMFCPVIALLWVAFGWITVFFEGKDR